MSKTKKQTAASKAGRALAAQRWGKPAAARGMRRPATRSAPAPTPRRAKAKKAVAAPAHHPIVLGILTVMALAVAAGMYVVLHTVLQPMYGDMGAGFRALVPLAVEMIAGFAAHAAFGKNAWVAVAAALVVLGCASADIEAAHAAPAAAQRQRIEAIQNEPAFRCAPYVQPAGYAGPTKTKELLAQYADGCKSDTKAAADRKAERLASAKASTPGEGRLAIELAILGAIGSSCFLPLLEAFLLAIRRK